MRYLHFVTEVCEWTEGRLARGDLAARAHATFGPTNPRARENLARLFEALDTWCGEGTRAFVERYLALDRHERDRVTIYPSRGESHVDLFGACCMSYGALVGQARAFSLERTLLYAALVHRAEKTAEFPRRLRVLRNLLKASEGAIRADATTELVAVVRRFVIDGDLTRLQPFNARQAEEERQKAKLLVAHPDLAPTLFKLEDHPLLRGCLAAFTLDASAFAAHAEAFELLFGDKALRRALTGALLACGEYARSLQGYEHRFQFGSGSKEKDEVWRRLLSGSELRGLDGTRRTLTALLDRFSATEGESAQRLDAITRAWLAERESVGEFDWRYYLVKYPAMREGDSGIYVGLNGSLGYSLCMLFKLRLSSHYRDPYVLAILRASGAPAGSVRDPWFTGYEHLPRWLHLERSGVELRCSPSRIELSAPTREGHAAAFAEVCARHGVKVDGALHVLEVPQVSHEGATSTHGTASNWAPRWCATSSPPGVERGTREALLPRVRRAARSSSAEGVTSDGWRSPARGRDRAAGAEATVDGAPDRLFFLETPPSGEAAHRIVAERDAWKSALVALEAEDIATWNLGDGWPVLWATRDMSSPLEADDQTAAVTAFFRERVAAAKRHGLVARYLAAAE